MTPGAEAQEASRELRERLLAQPAKVLLRVVIGPQFDQPLEFTGRELVNRAEALVDSLNLQRARSVVLLLLPHSAELFLLQVGLVLKGHIPAVLAWPTSRVDAEKYQRNVAHQLCNLPADLLVTLPRLVQNLSGALPYLAKGVTPANAASFEKMFPTAPVSERITEKPLVERRASPPGDALFLQFSGGTTGAQKAIVVTAGMLRAQFQQLGAALQFGAEDCVASWLPMYHDMGLIACYWMPLWFGAGSVQVAANDWVINPELLLRMVAKYRATFCWLPNFAFSYMSQRRESMQNELDLSSVRAWINCSEPVRRKSVQEFVAAFGAWGVKPRTIQASYAMAETVFAITQSEMGKELATVPRSELRQTGRIYAELAFDLIDDVYVSSGRALQGTEIRILDTSGGNCDDLAAGEIFVKTPALFSGYWGAAGFATHSLVDGWHATGDFGFMKDGELFVIGRFKDIVIVGGNNIFPEDVEAIVNTVDGVHAGRVVAFGVEDKEYGTQGLAVVAEVREEIAEERALELEGAIRKLVLAAIGTAPRYVAVVGQRWIVKSTAGKISRRETRERFVREKLGVA